MAEEKTEKKDAKQADQQPAEEPAAPEKVSYAGKGEAFFQRAEDVAGTGNWDFAIELYVQGIRREPDNLENGHKKLREIALKRKAEGGKGPGLKDQWTHRQGKDPLDNMANASFLFAKNPGSAQYGEQVMKAAVALELTDVISWIVDVLLDNQRQAKRADKRLCVAMTDAAAGIERYDQAMQACNQAMLASPNDPVLEERMRDLSSQYTIQKGRYGDEAHSFTEAVADPERQRELMQDDAAYKDDDYLQRQIKKATAAYEKDPMEYGKINALADALLCFEEESYESQAVEVLKKAYKDTGAYQFKLRIGDIRIRQYRRKLRQLMEEGDEAKVEEFKKKQLDFETKEYKERSENYPTDLGIKFEYARRLFMRGEYDQAITYFQQAQRNPRLHLSALNYLGQAFMAKDWWQEATETYEKALAEEITEARAKEIRYNLSICYEHLERLGDAQEQLSTIAQNDYNYKDVKQRLEKVRDKIKESH